MKTIRFEYELNGSFGYEDITALTYREAVDIYNRKNLPDFIMLYEI